MYSAWLLYATEICGVGTKCMYACGNIFKWRVFDLESMNLASYMRLRMS